MHCIIHVKTVEIMNSVNGDVMIQVEEEYHKGKNTKIFVTCSDYH